MPPGDDEPFLVVAASADGPDGARTVLAARGLELVEESTELVTGLLAIGLPIVLLVVGVVAWLLVGRSLAPVEAIRGEVEEISSTELHRRVPTPGGTDELARLAATMNEMLGRLERGQSRQRQLVADTSHELRSPIASIRQHAEVALAHPERTTASELAETVLAESLRLARLVDDLLLLARADEHTLALERRSLDLDDLVLDAARALRGYGHLEVDATGVSGGRVRGDPDGLRRVVSNLAENAARHARGRVAFSVVEDGDEVRSGWRTMARGSRQPIAIASSSDSCASTPRGLATPVAAGSGWRSWRSWSAHTGAAPSSARARSAGRWSRSGCRARRIELVQRGVRCQRLG